MILGEPGWGETYALRSVTESLNPSVYSTVYLPFLREPPWTCTGQLQPGLGEEPRFRKVDLFGQIQKAVGHLYYDKKITPVFITDEMHLARSDFLLDLAMIFNFSMDSKNPFVLVLSGLPFFQSRLRLNQAQPLAQRIIVQYKFEPPDKDEVKGYLDQRLRLAGAVTPIFTVQAIEAIASRTGGWPRLMNNLASTALLYSAQLKRSPIESEEGADRMAGLLSAKANGELSRYTREWCEPWKPVCAASPRMEELSATELFGNPRPSW